MAVVEVTEKAAEHIQALLQKNDQAVGLRLGTTKYGCSGLGYEIDYVTAPEADDEIVETQGVKVFVDRKALLHVMGTRIDWEDTMFSTGFTFSNPNEKGRCGCGESFTV